jgi:dipeptidyl aminopeptidase/acylaminoacyl peptidase
MMEVEFSTVQGMLPMLYRLLSVSLLLSLTSATAHAWQEAPAGESAVTPRPLKISDADDWQRVSEFTLSPDGTWSAHFLMPAEGDGQLIVRQTDQPWDGDGADEEAGDESGNEEARDKDADQPAKQGQPAAHYEFTVGPNSRQLRFSHDSRFLAWMQAPLDKAAKAAKKSSDPPKNKLVLLSLETGEQREFEKAQSFAFSNENPVCLAVRKMKPKGRPDGEKGWEGTDLLIHRLDSGTRINIGNVKSFAFNKPGTFLAMIIDAEDKTGNGLQLFHVNDSRIEALDNDEATYSGLSWTREGDALALLKSRKDDKYKNPHHELLAFADVGGARQKKIELDPVAIAAIPEGMTISPHRNPEWSDDRQLVFFGIHDLEAKDEDTKPEASEQGGAEGEAKPGAKDTGKPAGDEELAGLVIWHWQDPRLQSMQQKQESRDKNRSDLCVYQVASENTLRLADAEIPEVSVSRPHRFAVGTDDRKYERFGNLEGSRFRDVYCIDLKTGKRKLVLEKAQYVFNVSPNGTLLLYYKDDGHFYVYDMVRGSHTNITENVEASFVDTEDDHNVENPPRRPVGWTTDGDHVLLSDGWDIWMVSADGDEAVNLTVNGQQEQIRYRSPFRFDPDLLGIDVSGPVYITAYGEWTKQGGFGRLDPQQPGVEMLVWEDASFGRLEKLKDHEVYMFSRSTRQDPENYYVSGPDLDEPRRLTNANPHQKNFKWSAGVRLVDYTNSQGTRLQGALHLPADYIEGKKYPTIVYMYEKLSQTANRHDSPRAGGFSAAIYTSNGYAVFNPDIIFEVNDPGMASVDCILAGLDAAIETGVVDPDRLGLHGHSWGGYQTAFLITQTDRFKAAVAGAPLTNLISMYSSIYWNTGSANQPIFERSQGRFRGGYWDNLEAYARNSPVYHADKVTTPLLLLHNDEDGAVDWNQGIEYFNTLRRLDKPVVMLQYEGENHGLRKPANRKDYSYRMLDFFNHYLKGHDAPEWWSEGIKHLDMKEHIKDYRKSKTGDDRKDDS